jgi:hypothetical protein
MQRTVRNDSKGVNLVMNQNIINKWLQSLIVLCIKLCFVFVEVSNFSVSFSLLHHPHCHHHRHLHLASVNPKLRSLRWKVS